LLPEKGHFANLGGAGPLPPGSNAPAVTKHSGAVCPPHTHTFLVGEPKCTEQFEIFYDILLPLVV
jgi:hypothetical protein